MAKHKYIKTPEALWELFVKYATEVKNNPRKKDVFGGKDFDHRYESLERPLTMVGFEVFCYKEIGCVNHYFDNTDGRYEEYSTICSRIRAEIKADQIDGGMCGVYNTSITQRLNGLTDKQEKKIETKDTSHKAEWGS